MRLLIKSKIQNFESKSAASKISSQTIKMSNLDNLLVKTFCCRQKLTAYFLQHHSIAKQGGVYAGEYVVKRVVRRDTMLQFDKFFQKLFMAFAK